ncbi:heme peroxidase [Rhizobium sophorae]|uniref:Heme peroxidase n=1 Tax=Rhizobium sophorae TaxID=1535242 RepID=A0A7Y3S8Z8_9HYPH|nr:MULTISPECIES: heme peroxidase family protein [Rhizobium]MBX4858870.1 heme peroxidase [Rhizobium bangladeshense]NKK71676.1 heme peroxidase [Rhizobium leguminosarum bv. viciae]MCV9943172.1 heme peroxidase family protein [Rhizobium sp. BT-175]MCW0014838.1 heme peroxidase family protein [Rhizobium sp. BT-226]NNU39112.1 heme peroxidase [Rhizobium sophorae]
MAIVFQSHGGAEKERAVPGPSVRAGRPATGDVAVDEEADFGYFVPPLDAPENYLPNTAETLGELDELGDMMIDVVATPTSEDPTEDSTLPPVFTYWGQFLDHELTARTDREGAISSMVNAHPPVASSTVESQFRNARSPRFDLDSVYGGSAVGEGIDADVVKVISGLRHPTLKDKMRVGTAVDPGPLPDNLDEHRDLPRYGQVQSSVREAALRLAQAAMTPEAFQKFSDSLPQRAIIGDNRNDENLVVAQFHLSFLRFHNKAVDYLASHDTGWIADFSSAQALTRLHYQWLIVEGYLKGVCDPVVVDRVVKDRASHFFKFRAEFDARRQNTRLGNALPLEFSTAAYRFGHSMVRAFYDYNKNFGRPGTGFLPRATLQLLFEFTGGGGRLDDDKKLPKNWIIDWTRFTGADPHDAGDGEPARLARRIDTELAPPLHTLFKEGEDQTNQQLKALFKNLARRNLRRGYNLRLPTGQALHKHLNQIGAVQSSPIQDVSALFAAKPDLKNFLAGTASRFHERTPLWFYILAEAEAAGGNRLGEVGSCLVASTFVGVLLADPDSALSRGFTPNQSPLKMPDNSPIDSIAKWMRFAAVMQ